MSDKKRTRKRTKKDQALSPAHEAAQGTAHEEGFPGHVCDEQCRPDMGKALSNAVPVGGNIPDVPDYNSRRVSAPIGPGHQGYSSGNHGVGQGRSSSIAAGHRDLRQSNTDFSQVLARLRSNPYSYVGQAAFNGSFGATDRPADAPGDSVVVHGFEAASEAGSYGGLRHHPQAPDIRTDYRTAPIGSSNGTHNSSSRYGAVSRSPVSAKASNLDIMRDTMRIIGA